jgi:hypothetical protein
MANCRPQGVPISAFSLGICVSFMRALYCFCMSLQALSGGGPPMTLHKLRALFEEGRQLKDSLPADDQRTE